MKEKNNNQKTFTRKDDPYVVKIPHQIMPYVHKACNEPIYASHTSYMGICSKCEELLFIREDNGGSVK